MEEIKVGLYGRTNLGNIIKFAYFCDENNEIYTNKVILIDEVTKSPRPYYYFKEDERIVKESKNIIDLIEVGDIVRIEFPPDEYCNEPEELNYNEFLRLNGGKIVKYGEKQDIRVENNRYIDYSGEYEWILRRRK